VATCTNTESTPSCRICTLAEGEKPHLASYRVCCHEIELQRRRAQRAPKGSSRRKFFSKFTSPEQSFAAALRQDAQHQQPQAQQTYGKSLQLPVQQHLPQQENQKTGLSVQAPCSSNTDTLKIATVVQRTMRVLSEAGYVCTLDKGEAIRKRQPQPLVREDVT
jgi:hypothetical protein